ncbi:MAG: EAL domain-containing protein [Roseovarius sp.]|uniref:EAL domain-containing protein n=1 Tax=Roseovarius sp. TaxID=1486281 RepID=UPI0032ED826A
MGQDPNLWADIPAGHDSPLNFAVTSRDRSVIEMVTDAVQNDRAMLANQAIVPAGAPNKPAFYEGLIRVMDSTGRIIPACDFIAEIETTETGRIIDCIALEQGLKAMHDYPDLRLAINMSARSIGYPRWLRTLRKGLRADPTAGERLILEITESSAIVVPELVVNFMTEMQAESVSFALDDFGSGYTSFRYLKQFYFDILKIDGQFIRGIARDPDNQVLTGALMSVAEQFDMVCIAESVETAEDAAFLQNIGMDCLQGYFFGAPTVRPPWDTETGESATA